MPRLLPFLAVPCLVLATGAAADPVTILHADFNDKTLDSTIGTGGPEMGEPESVASVGAVVRSTPFPTPNLELTDILEFGTGAVRFGFTPQAEIKTGLLTISVNLWFHEFDKYPIYVREYRHAAHSFLTMDFRDGQIFVSDAGGTVSGSAGTFTTGRSYALLLEFDMDQGTYDITFDGNLLVDDQPHDVPPKHGIGGLIFGLGHDTDLDGHWSIDDLLVTATMLPSPVRPETLGRMKDRYRD